MSDATGEKKKYAVFARKYCRLFLLRAAIFWNTAIDVNRLDPTEGKPLEEVHADLAQWAEENGITGIVPLAHNLAFDLSFLKASFPAFSRIVSGHGRNSMRLAITRNDLARMQDGEVRFPQRLASVAQTGA